MGHLPFQEKCVVTQTGHPYIGVDFAKKLCGVSIIRSGESMENALRACCKGIKIGKILVHRSAASPSCAAPTFVCPDHLVQGFLILMPCGGALWNFSRS